MFLIVSLLLQAAKRLYYKRCEWAQNVSINRTLSYILSDFRYSIFAKIGYRLSDTENIGH